MPGIRQNRPAFAGIEAADLVVAATCDPKRRHDIEGTRIRDDAVTHASPWSTTNSAVSDRVRGIRSPYVSTSIALCPGNRAFANAIRRDA